MYDSYNMRFIKEETAVFFINRNIRDPKMVPRSDFEVRFYNRKSDFFISLFVKFSITQLTKKSNLKMLNGLKFKLQ